MWKLDLFDSRILCFLYVLESIHKFIIQLHVLQCLFVRWSNKKQRRGRIISYFTNYFSSLVTAKCSWGESENVTPHSCSLQKRHSSPIQFAQKDNIPENSIGRGACLFILKIVWMFPTPTSKNRIMNIFIRVNITPTCKR